MKILHRKEDSCPFHSAEMTFGYRTPIWPLGLPLILLGKVVNCVSNLDADDLILNQINFGGAERNIDVTLAYDFHDKLQVRLVVTLVNSNNLPLSFLTKEGARNAPIFTVVFVPAFVCNCPCKTLKIHLLLL